MKLKCVVIVAVLFLTACQLITADFFGNKEKNLAMKLRKNVKNSKLTKSCKPNGETCRRTSNNCCNACMIREPPNKPVCSDK